MTSPAWQDSPRHVTFVLLIFALCLHHGECISGAAASGAIYALGIGKGGGGERMRDEDAEAVVMLMLAAAVVGVIFVGLIYGIYKLVRRYVFKIQEPAKNFVVDKKVKCVSGEADDIR